MISQQLSKMDRKICNLEAALYSAGRPLSLDDVKPIVGTRSDKTAKKLVEQLIKRYKGRHGALEITIHKDHRISLQLREKYEKIVKDFNHKPLLKSGPLRTLSYIAFHQPVDQRQVISDRGAHVYGHLRMMESMGLISRERTEDRSYMITTTSFFGDYFGFSHNPGKSKLQLKRIFKELKITKLENGNTFNEFEEEEEEDKVDELADTGDGFTQGLSQYAGSTNRSD
jgi:segregation and condensation protein B